MGTSLTKGANVALTASDPALTRVLVSLGWNSPASDQPFDLDASALLCGADGKVPNQAHFVFYNQLARPGTAVQQQGQEQTGADGQDDEQVEVDLARVPAYVDKVVFAVSIHQAAERRQTFAQLGVAFIRVSNLDTGAEIVRYDLDRDCGGETAMVFGELYRHSGGWKFRAVGQGWAEGLEGIARAYGVGRA